VSLTFIDIGQRRGGKWTERDAVKNGRPHLHTVYDFDKQYAKCNSPVTGEREETIHFIVKRQDYDFLFWKFKTAITANLEHETVK
jgi:hypothetical protein